MSLAQYARFLLVGGFVALVTIAARELVAFLLGHDTASNYSISVVLAYALGIALSYLLNHRFTFQQDSSAGSKALFMFVLVALFGMAITALLSLAIRYGAGVDSIAGTPPGLIAFGTAAVLSSLITYPLNATFVFRAR